MKTGLVLEGGAMRGMFTAGVLDVLMENGAAFDGVIGVSAGACFGCNYKSGQIGRAIRYNKKYSRDWRYCSLRSLLLTGDLYGADFCYGRIPRELDPFDDAAFSAHPSEFWVVATDVDTGEAVYRRCDVSDDETMQWIRASASMPLVSRKVEIGGRRLWDGGIADSVPLRYFESIGYDRNVVILTQPQGFVKQPASGMGIMKRLLPPRVADAMARRHEVYNQTTAYIQTRMQQGAALVIQPQEALPISRTERDPNKLQAVYDIGRRTGEAKLAEVMAFLA